MSEHYVDLLRHGEVLGGKRFHGRSDAELSDLGWAQMSHAVMDSPTWTHVISSPLTRCSAFAKSFAETYSLPLDLMDSLRERDFGDWDGCAPNDIPLEDLKRFWDDPVDFTPPGAEHFSDFRERVLKVWRQILERSDQHTLVVTHGGVIRTVLADLLMMPPAALLLIEVPHACRSRIRAYDPPGRPSLVFHRDP